MKIEFPVFVLTKDCGEIARFSSIGEMQQELECIDVENGEYAAWDSFGRGVELKTQPPTWLCLESDANGRAPDSLVTALENYAASLGISVKIESAAPESLEKAYKEIRAHTGRRHLLGWLFDRFKSW